MSDSDQLKNELMASVLSLGMYRPALQDILDKYVRELGATGRLRSGD
jgi:hypothetical protein